MEIERNPDQDQPRRETQSARPAESLDGGGPATTRQAVDLPAPAAREINTVADAPWELDLTQGESLLRFLSEHASTSQVDGVLTRAQRKPGEEAKEGDVLIGDRGDFFLVSANGKNAWSPSGRTVADTTQGMVVAQDRLQAGLESVVKAWKEAAGGERVDRALEHAFDGKLPEGKWVNFGDQSYVEFGGTQLKREGQSIDLVDLSHCSEPEEGDSFHLSKGNVIASDLITERDGACVFTQDFMSAIGSTKADALPSDRLVDLTDAQVQGAVEEFLLGTASQGAVLEQDRNWEPRKMLQDYAKACPLGGVSDLSEAIPVSGMKLFEALDSTHLQDWVLGRVADDLSALGLAGVWTDTGIVRYPDPLPTPKGLLVQGECEDLSLVLVHDLLGRPRNYVQEVAIREGSATERVLQEQGFVQNRGYMDAGHQCWVFSRSVDLEKAMSAAIAPEVLLAERMSEFHDFFNRAAESWIMDRPLVPTPAELASIAQLIDGALAWQSQTEWDIPWTNQEREGLLGQMVTGRWAFLKRVTASLSEEELAGISKSITDSVATMWEIDSMWEKEGVADRFTVVMNDRTALGLSENPDQPNGFSQWCDQVSPGPHLGQALPFHQVPTTVLRHLFERISPRVSTPLAEDSDAPTAEEIQAEIAEAERSGSARYREALGREDANRESGRRSARTLLNELLVEKGLGWRQALQVLSERAEELSMRADASDDSAVRLEEGTIANGYHDVVKEMRQRPEFPDHILQKLRERKGLEPADASRDREIREYTPIEALEEMAAWELGDPRWASTFVRWAKECGFSVVERKNRDQGWIEAQAAILALEWQEDRQVRITTLAEMTPFEAVAVGACAARLLGEGEAQAFLGFMGRLAHPKA